jgi:hypothetical protein
MAEPKPALTMALLQKEVGRFADDEARHQEPILFGVTDGKKVGTYVELKFRRYLSERYSYEEGNAAKGIDFPGLGVDLKVTSLKQPQSSSPFSSARQKVYGLGHSLIVLVYDKADDAATRTSNLVFIHRLFVEAARTADFQTTTGILQLLRSDANADDLVAFFEDRNLPLDEIGRRQLADEVLANPPLEGVLTISNALQWRLQYGRAIENAGAGVGIVKL